MMNCVHKNTSSEADLFLLKADKIDFVIKMTNFFVANIDSKGASLYVITIICHEHLFNKEKDGNLHY
jgi:hypothetical protein